MAKAWKRSTKIGELIPHKDVFLWVLWVGHTPKDTKIPFFLGTEQNLGKPLFHSELQAAAGLPEESKKQSPGSLPVPVEKKVTSADLF